MKEVVGSRSFRKNEFEVSPSSNLCVNGPSSSPSLSPFFVSSLPNEEGSSEHVENGPSLALIMSPIKQNKVQEGV